MEILKKLCADVDADRTWSGVGRLATNLRVADLEAQGSEKFPEWREKLRAELKQVG